MSMVFILQVSIFLGFPPKGPQHKAIHFEILYSSNLLFSTTRLITIIACIVAAVSIIISCVLWCKIRVKKRKQIPKLLTVPTIYQQYKKTGPALLLLPEKEGYTTPYRW